MTFISNLVKGEYVALHNEIEGKGTSQHVNGGRFSYAENSCSLHALGKKFQQYAARMQVLSRVVEYSSTFVMCPFGDSALVRTPLFLFFIFGERAQPQKISTTKRFRVSSRRHLRLETYVSVGHYTALLCNTEFIIFHCKSHRKDPNTLFRVTSCSLQRTILSGVRCKNATGCAIPNAC